MTEYLASGDLLATATETTRPVGPGQMMLLEFRTTRGFATNSYS